MRLSFLLLFSSSMVLSLSGANLKASHLESDNIVIDQSDANDVQLSSPQLLMAVSQYE